MKKPVQKKAKFEKDGEADHQNGAKFKYWESLPMEIRCMIIKEIDVLTRFSLMFTSKRNYRVARSVPIKIESITVRDKIMALYPEIDYDRKFVSVQLEKYNPLEPITTVFFVEDRDDTMVYRFWSKNKQMCVAKTILLTNTNYFKESMLFLEKLMKLTDYQMDAFQMNVDYGRYNLEFLKKLRIKKELYVIASGVVYLNSWLNTANSPLEKLGIRLPKDDYEYPSFFDRSYLIHETIINSKELKFTNGARCPKSLDFPRLKCDIIDIHAPEVTPEIVNHFLKEWINGDAPANFSRAQVSGTNFFINNDTGRVMLRGLFRSRWRHEYRIGDKPLHDLFNGFEYGSARESDCYYIETKKQDNGAALIFGERKVLFLVSGKQTGL